MNAESHYRKTTRDLRRRALESEAISLIRYLPQEYQSGDRVEDYQQAERLLKKTKIAALREHVAEMRLFLLRHRMVCNCWHLSEGESDAMWKLYGGGVGVMLVSTIARLRAAIKGRYSRVFCDPNPQEYSLAPVRYVDEKDLSRLPRFYLDRPWLLKRASFAHEREMRVSHELPWMMIDFEEGGMMIDMDPQELISEIVLSPFNPAWADRPLATAIKVVSERAGVAVPITRSNHMQPPARRSKILEALEFMKLRDSWGGGRQLRVQRG